MLRTRRADVVDSIEWSYSRLLLHVTWSSGVWAPAGNWVGQTWFSRRWVVCCKNKSIWLKPIEKRIANDYCTGVGYIVLELLIPPPPHSAPSLNEGKWCDYKLYMLLCRFAQNSKTKKDAESSASGSIHVDVGLIKYGRYGNYLFCRFTLMKPWRKK